MIESPYSLKRAFPDHIPKSVPLRTFFIFIDSDDQLLDKIQAKAPRIAFEETRKKHDLSPNERVIIRDICGFDRFYRI